MDESQLISRLCKIRSAIRRRLLAYGLCAVVAGGVAAFLTIVALDWSLWLPSLLRVALAGLFLVGFVAATVHWIVRPLSARLGLVEVAARLEAHFDTLRDRLTSTVDFLATGEAAANPPSEHTSLWDRPQSGSAAFQSVKASGNAPRCTVPTAPTALSTEMMQQVARNTEELTASVPLESALSLRPLLHAALLMSGSLALLGGIQAAAPDWTATGFYRYVAPWSDLEWPRTVSILPLTGDQTVAVGEPATVRMQVQRGLHDTLRGIVRFQDPGGRTTSLAMERDDHGLYAATLDAVTTDLVYWFEAGDATTQAAPYTIRAHARPEVVEALATIEPPPYAVGCPARVQGLDEGPVQAPIGGTVRLAFLVSRPMPVPVPDGSAVLSFEDGSVLPLTVDTDDPRRLTAILAVERDRRFLIKLRDEQGFENRGAARYAIRATPDTPPSVTFLQPTAVTDLTPRGVVALQIRVEDDFGISKVALEVRRPGAARPETVPLSEHPETPPVNRAATVGKRNPGLVRMISSLWSIAPFSLSAGDVLVFSAVATDNHPAPNGVGGVGQIGRSESMRIRVISEAEFEIRLRGDLASLEAQIRRVILDESDVLDRTESLMRDVADPEPEPSRDGKEADLLTGVERDRVTTLTVRQARLIRQLGVLARRFRTLLGRMERNRVGDVEARDRMRSVADSLVEVSGGEMTDARSALSAATDTDVAVRQQRHIAGAVRNEKAAIDTLQTLLDSMAQWGDFQQLVATTRDLLDRQASLRSRTVELGKIMIGKPVDTLTDAQRGRLTRLAREQKQLAADVDRHLERMKRLAAVARDEAAGGDRPGNRAGADAIDDALRAARAHDIKRQLSTATRRIGENRTAAATLAQKAAAQALRKMVDALRERQDRALEELRKRVERAQDRVAALLEQQRALRAATGEAALIGTGAEGIDDLADTQRALKTNTKLLGEDLVRTPRVAAAGRRVRRATAPMGRAETRLRERQPQRATPEQDSATALLEEAMEQLDQIADAAVAEAIRRSLAQIRDVLEAITAAQREVNEGIVRLRGTIKVRERIGRAQARAATRLARRQAAARSMVQSQLHEFKKVLVYQWALERVAGWMDTSRERLNARQIDDELVLVTSRIVHELETLIQAIADTQALPLDTQFVESGGSGGEGKSGAANGKPVPTVAELLVLRSMQVDINERTRSLYASVDVTRANEQQLGKLKTVGEDQREVRRLTELVTNRVRGP